MDARGFQVMLDEIVRWMEDEVPPLLVEYARDVTACFDGVVLDGDSSTDRFVIAVHDRALVATASASRVCASLRVRPCSNHLAKNIGKKAYELGHALHKSCSCAPVLTKDLQERKDGRRSHRGVNTASHPLVKVIQRGMSAAMRGAVDLPLTADCPTMADMGVACVEECLAHVFDVHEGEGLLTGKLCNPSS